METKNYNYDYILPFFVSTDNLRPVMRKPAELSDGNVYASNGHMLAIVPAHLLAKKYTSPEKYPSADKVMQEHGKSTIAQFTIETDTLVEALTKVQWIMKYKETEECSNCDGDGEAECCSCGHMCTCTECDGTGEVETDKPRIGIYTTAVTSRVVISDKCFNAAYINAIVVSAKMLGAKEIHIKLTGCRSAIFSFAGIQIMLMEIYDAPEDEDVIIPIRTSNL